MILSVFHMVSEEEFDTHDPKAHHFLKLSFLKKRSRIVEIRAARDTVFALTHSGICATFSRGTEISPVVLRPYLLDVLLSAVFLGLTVCPNLFNAVILKVLPCFPPE
jgi:hypothetical protein